MSNLVDYAKDELKRIGMIDSGEAYNDFATKAILDLIELFASQYHSGFTASYVANMFHRLAMFKPASPLTGEDDEWLDLEDGLFQNKRYSAVFKDKDGTAYNIEGRVFTDDGEVWYTCRDSRVNVTFPYVVPDKPEYVYRNNKEKVVRMREATPEERESIENYIKSISKTTVVISEELKQEPKWIPISERLPEDGTWNLFTDGMRVSVERYKADAMDHFYPSGRWFSLDEAIAWMPLPPCYEPQERDVN